MAGFYMAYLESTSIHHFRKASPKPLEITVPSVPGLLWPPDAAGKGLHPRHLIHSLCSTLLFTWHVGRHSLI